jgi:predicted RNA methylase
MAARHTFKISDAVRDVLARSTITATSVKLPEQLDRKAYDAVNKALAGAGGKWNKKAGAHLFDRDPREALGLAIETGEAVNLRTKLQAFYTPAPLADRVAAAAKLKHGYRVLEPSAGAGALVTAAMKIAAVDVDAYDVDPDVQDRLSAIGVEQAALTGGSLSVRIQDFLLAEPNQVYDAALMNPPFQGGQDMAHVTHAWRFVKPGGVLVAIMGAGPSGFRDATTKAAVAFRALVASAKSSEVTEIPGGTFEDTGVATVMLVMRKA